ncbi:hypothetical protein [Acanthopleuribacter pedis]|uniref:Uncharacterized protein n=1 Tax=Acanthopleuribacter pedis TaxID=442870 RepID=A0A8J7QAZ6_9BACT|nr:hypothetical protein [Acanthopleuribacter pedis]MBO1317516.1 hypothetical protein [Acanthopleuribacter pedis]
MSTTCPKPSRVFVLLLLLAGGRLLAQEDALFQTLEQTWRDASAAVTTRVPSAEELARVEALFVRTLSGERDSGLVVAWRQFGFRFYAVGEGEIWALRDIRNFGRGFYLFRPPGALPVLLQAPHAFHDLDTGEIAMRWFVEGPWLAGAWNTAHRYEVLPDLRPVDWVDRRDQYGQALTAAALSVMSRGVIVQLHGFEQMNRVTPAGRDAAVILSNGRETPSPAVWSLDACFEGFQLGQVRVFGEDVMELGGTRNQQALAVHADGGRLWFLHLEMDRPLRRNLVRDRSLRDDLAGCLLDRRLCGYPPRSR